MTDVRCSGLEINSCLDRNLGAGVFSCCVAEKGADYPIHKVSKRWDVDRNQCSSFILMRNDRICPLMFDPDWCRIVCGIAVKNKDSLRGQSWWMGGLVMVLARQLLACRV